MKPDIIYLDNAATTKLDPRALSVMLPWLKMSYGNPSSLHALGLEAYRALEAAREQCGRLLDAPSERIVFTSSGTEANNLIIKGLRPRLEGRRVLATRLEHASVLEPLAFLASRGIEVTWIDIDDRGHVDQKHLDALLAEKDCGLCCLIHGSNEVGTLQNLAGLAKRIRKKSPATWIHVDGVQSVGHVPVEAKPTKIHSLTVSGHKLHGPRGAALVAFFGEDDLRSLEPLHSGGGQEHGLRSGTENLSAIIGLTEALRLALAELDVHAETMRRLRDLMAHELEVRIPDLRINGAPLEGLPHILSLSFKGLLGEVLLHHLEERGVMVSTGSACHAKWNDLSETLKALKVPTDFARGTIRISFSRLNTEREVLDAARIIEDRVKHLREIGL